jgi:hypothetical protein
MFPDDRVLIGSIRRKSDWEIVRDQAWYRIPVKKMPDFTDIEYIGFFMSRSALQDQLKGKPSGIYYYAKVAGMEMHNRHDIIPDEPDKPNDPYHVLTLKDLQPLPTPILNPTGRRFAFIYTTGDRFQAGTEIADLYSKADHFVERIYHRLYPLFKGRIERFWQAQYPGQDFMTGIRITRSDVMDQSIDVPEIVMSFSADGDEDEVLAMIREQVAKHSGPLIINIPFV